MKFWNKTKKCEVCLENKPKEDVDNVGMGRFVCKSCNTPENKEKMKQRAIESAEALGLPRDFVEKLVNK